MKPKDHLVTLSNLQKRKDEEYGEAWRSGGKVWVALFPDGVTLKTESDFGRFGLLNMIVGKVNRYVKNWQSGHPDSLDDLAVYATMLRAMDDEKRPRKVDDISDGEGA